ncbi:hypothetical protein Dimus_032812 [Dionaea muscipula]
MGRAPCCDHKSGLKKGPWTSEEDQKLIDYIQKHGCGNWRTLPKNAGLERCGKSCRLRWTNYLRPDIKRGRFSFEEEETIIHLHSILGNRWSAIAGRLPGRTDNEIKNYWNTHIRKRLLRMGIDPVTHSPRLDLLDLSSILNMPASHAIPTMSTMMLGLQQSLVKRDLVSLAASLLSSVRSQNQNHPSLSFPLQNLQPNHDQLLLSTSTSNENQQQNHQVQELIIQPPPTTHDQFPLLDHEVQVMMELEANRQVQYQSIIDDFDAQNQLGSVNVYEQQQYWQGGDDASCLGSGMVQAGSVSQENIIVVDHDAAENSNLMISNSTSSSSSSKQNGSFESVLSTPCSSPSLSPSPAPFDHYEDYFNNWTIEEDERDSYCSNIMNLEVPPQIFDLSEFM